MGSFLSPEMQYIRVQMSVRLVWWFKREKFPREGECKAICGKAVMTVAFDKGMPKSPSVATNGIVMRSCGETPFGGGVPSLTLATFDAQIGRRRRRGAVIWELEWSICQAYCSGILFLLFACFSVSALPCWVSMQLLQPQHACAAPALEDRPAVSSQQSAVMPRQTN